MNQFPVIAAEKLTAIRTAESYFAALRGRGNVEEAVAFLSRSGGEPPRAGDERPFVDEPGVA